MKKYFLIATLSLLVLSGCNGNNKLLIESDGLIYHIVDSDSVYVSSYTDKVAEIIFIPEKVETYSVIGIEKSAFSNCRKIKGVMFENSSLISTIGSYAFSNCASLTSIAIPESVTSIGFKAFEGCSSLHSITLPFIGETEKANQYLGYIFGAKEYSENYKYVPESLSEVTIRNDHLCEIPNDAFYSCSSLTQIRIPTSVTLIESGAFSCCSSLSSIEIPSSVTSIGKDAFFACESLQTIKIPTGVNHIRDCTFSWCASLSSIEIPSSVTSIGKDAFYGCVSLQKITIPDETEYIGKYAFSDCSLLASIVIPSSVSYVGTHVFSGCSSLSIYCEPISKPIGWDRSWNPDNRPVIWNHHQ